MPQPPDTLIIKREISTLAREFKRELSLAFPGMVKDEGSHLRVATGETVLDIELVVGEPRAIASIRLPTLFVTLSFSGGTAAQQKNLLAHMDRAMHRGGG
jgi:hypothetical protein